MVFTFYISKILNIDLFLLWVTVSVKIRTNNSNNCTKLTRISVLPKQTSVHKLRLLVSISSAVAPSANQRVDFDGKTRGWSSLVARVTEKAEWCQAFSLLWLLSSVISVRCCAFWNLIKINHDIALVISNILLNTSSWCLWLRWHLWSVWLIKSTGLLSFVLNQGRRSKTVYLSKSRLRCWLDY